MLMLLWHHGADFLWINKLKQTEMKCLEMSYISILSHFIAAQLAPWSWWETGRWGKSSDPSWRTLPSSCRRLWHQLLQQQAEGGIRKYFRSFHPTVDYATKHAQSKWTIKMNNINIAQYHTQYLLMCNNVTTFTLCMITLINTAFVFLLLPYSHSVIFYI